VTQTDTPSVTTEVPWHLRGNFAPVDSELDAADLEIIGEVPAELRGTYVRQSFNPRTGASPH
jgi:carotenoid cleavage dioxygenase